MNSRSSGIVGKAVNWPWLAWLALVPLTIEVISWRDGSRGLVGALVERIRPYPHGSGHWDVVCMTLLILPISIMVPARQGLWRRFLLTVVALAGIWTAQLIKIGDRYHEGMHSLEWLLCLVLYMAALTASVAAMHALASLSQHLWRIPRMAVVAAALGTAACLAGGLAAVAHQGMESCTGSLVALPTNYPHDCTSLPVQERFRTGTFSHGYLGPFTIDASSLPFRAFAGWIPLTLQLPGACTRDTVWLNELPSYADDTGGLHDDREHARWLVTGGSFLPTCPRSDGHTIHRRVVGAFRVEPPGPLRSLPRYRLSLALTALAALTLAYVARQLRRSPSAEGTSAATSESGEGLTEEQRAVRRAVVGLLAVALLMTLGACAFVAALPS